MILSGSGTENVNTYTGQQENESPKNFRGEDLGSSLTRSLRCTKTALYPPEEYEQLLNHLQHDLATRMPGFDHGMGFLDILKRENGRDMRLELTIRHHL